MTKSGACHLAFFKSDPLRRDGLYEEDGYCGVSSLCRGQRCPRQGGGAGGGPCPESAPVLAQWAWGLCMGEGKETGANAYRPGGQGTHAGAKAREERGLGPQDELWLWPVGAMATPGKWTSLSTPGRRGASGRGHVLARPCNPESSSRLCLSPAHHAASTAPHTSPVPTTFWNDGFSLGRRSHCDSWPHTISRHVLSVPFGGIQHQRVENLRFHLRI